MLSIIGLALSVVCGNPLWVRNSQGTNTAVCLLLGVPSGSLALAAPLMPVSLEASLFLQITGEKRRFCLALSALWLRRQNLSLFSHRDTEHMPGTLGSSWLYIANHRGESFLMNTYAVRTGRQGTASRRTFRSHP